MIEHDDIKVKLDHQANFIIDLIISLEFLINYSDFHKSYENSGMKYLGFIYKVIRDNSILTLNKLFNRKEKYSFDQLSNLIINNISGDSKLKEEYKILIKEGNKLYEILEINYIRNKHVGHLQPTRKARTIDWLKVKELARISCDIHDKANLMFFKEQSAWNYDEDILNNIFLNHMVYGELLELSRKNHRNNIDLIKLEDIDKLLHLNWIKKVT